MFTILTFIPSEIYEKVNSNLTTVSNGNEDTHPKTTGAQAPEIQLTSPTHSTPASCLSISSAARCGDQTPTFPAPFQTPHSPTAHLNPLTPAPVLGQPASISSSSLALQHQLIHPSTSPVDSSLDSQVNSTNSHNHASISQPRINSSRLSSDPNSSAFHAVVSRRRKSSSSSSCLSSPSSSSAAATAAASVALPPILTPTYAPDDVASSSSFFRFQGLPPSGPSSSFSNPFLFDCLPTPTPTPRAASSTSSLMSSSLSASTGAAHPSLHNNQHHPSPQSQSIDPFRRTPSSFTPQGENKPMLPCCMGM